MSKSLKHIEEKALLEFKLQFNLKAEALIHSPGRVNLIGEYTDLNHGFVMPMAIDRFLVMAVKKREDSIINVYSIDFDNKISVDVNQLTRTSSHSFQDYLTGCIWALKQNGFDVKGFDCTIISDIPIGAGLSSSAAFEMAVLKAASFSSNFVFDPLKMAQLGQIAENDWVGVNCGIMDQLICSAGVKGHALKIDCHDLSYKTFPLPNHTSVIVLDTDTRRDLKASAYNERRSQCFSSAEKLGVGYLKDATIKMLNEHKADINELEYKRSHHVVTENFRVKEMAIALKHGDAVTAGLLMNQSHESLNKDFEVTNEALNTIVACSQKEADCLGARMTGAGFGGCAVALINESQKELFIENVSRCYRKKTGLTPKIYICRPSDGVSLEKLNR
jgi:galactokinase